MFELKDQVFEIIKSAASCIQDRKRWLGPEVADLGQKYHGLDDIPLDSVLILAALFTNDDIDDNEILKRTGIDSNKFVDFIDALIEYNLIGEKQDSGMYELTQHGKSSCSEIFKNVVTRKRFELKRDLQHMDQLHLKILKI